RGARPTQAAAGAGKLKQHIVTDLSQFIGSFSNGSGEGNEQVENTNEGVKSIAKRALSAAKNLAESLQEQIGGIETAIDNFPNTKSLDEEIDVTGEDIGTYLTFTKGEATLGASAETTDDAAIAENLSNLKKIFGEASLDIEVNPTNELYSASSAIKDLKFRMKAAGNVKAVANEDPSKAPTITLNYRESLSIGLSFCNSGKGGKFVIKEDADYSRTFTGEEFDEAMNPEDAEDSNELIPGLLEPNITISLKVYDDNNQVKFSKTYNSIEEFTTAFAHQEPTE
ncbi:MAG TPA: hypothetical protein PK996_08580, partial [Rectinema sp.]|nr:hypothetical protein [Rectinema sp.]